MQIPALVPILRGCAIAAAMFIATAGGVSAQMLSGSDLVTALKQGGYVIVMRHANSPQIRPEAALAAPGNTGVERQLNENGHKAAHAMGQALKTLQIPIGTVLSSPTFRTRETVQELQVGMPDTFNLLGDGSQGYEFSSFEDSARFMRVRAAEIPKAGTNTLIVTHLPNIESAFGETFSVDEGEVVVLKPDGMTGTPVGRIKIDEWPRLAARR
jgi:phosphohistidine phosphatase SixA